MHWDVEDPFTFVSHHEDDYPPGNAQQAPPMQEIGGRDLGRDYKSRFGYRMYHGKVVPGFPNHAHWGYEIITCADIGFVDHFDFLGNQGRYGFGDYQWITAGGRYQHCEMYPLASNTERNPNDITQIMINLPLESKNKEPRIKTVWSENIPIEKGDGYTVKLIVGKFGKSEIKAPHEESWAYNPSHNVRIMKIGIMPGKTFEIDAVDDKINRNLYLISETEIILGEKTFKGPGRFKLKGNEKVSVINGKSESVCWLLEGTPIAERQTSFGPVILKNDKEVRKALDVIRLEEYSSWPWDVIDKAQPKDTGRFIKYSDGTEDRP